VSLLQTLSLAFAVLTLLVIGLLALCLRQRFGVARRPTRHRTDTEPAVADAATKEE